MNKDPFGILIGSIIRLIMTVPIFLIFLTIYLVKITFVILVSPFIIAFGLLEYLLTGETDTSYFKDVFTDFYGW